MKIKSIVKQVVAQLKGDDAEVIAQKIYRQADSALKTHIANMKGNLIEAEDRAETASEHAKSALSNHAQLITDRTKYVDNLLSADADLKLANEELAYLKETINFLEEKLVELNQEEG